MSHRDQPIRIPIPQTDLAIYGLMDGSFDRPCVLLLHGLTGHTNEAQFVVAAEQLHRAGYSVLRVNLYSWQDDARNLEDCTLRMHANDLDVILAWLRAQGTPKIAVIGHSFGAVTAILSQTQDWDALVLWDPSHQASSSFTADDAEDEVTFVPALNMYRLTWGFDVLAPKAMGDELEELVLEEEFERITSPTLIVSAGDMPELMLRGAELYMEHARCDVSRVVIGGSDHTFSRKPWRDELLRETEAFLRRSL